MKTKQSLLIMAMIILALLVFGCSTNNSPTGSSINNETAQVNGQGFPLTVSTADDFTPTRPLPVVPSSIPVSPISEEESMVIKIGTAHNQAVLNIQFNNYDDAVAAYNDGTLVPYIWQNYFAELGILPSTRIPSLPDFAAIDADSGYAMFLANTQGINLELVQRIVNIYDMHMADKNSADIYQALDEMVCYVQSTNNPNDVGVAGVFWGSFQLNCLGWQGNGPTGNIGELWDDVIHSLPIVGDVNVGTAISLVANLFGI